jgi:hypothetical protein
MHQQSDTPAPDPAQFWIDFGFEVQPTSSSSPVVQGYVPAGHVALLAQGADALAAQEAVLQAIGAIPRLWCHTASEAKIAVFKLASNTSLADLAAKFGEQVDVIGEGGIIPLPTGRHLTGLDHLQTLDDLSEIDIATPTAGNPAPKGPLSTFSLLGQGAALEGSAQPSNAILGGAILAGQATAIYAAPNVGKTLLALYLLTEAVHAQRIKPAATYYINADDSSKGMAEKLLLLDELGVHTLVPGYKGFTPARLTDALAKMVRDDLCRGVVVVIDTLKKFVDLMDKKSAAAFGDQIRQFVLRGGTVIALAHTRKNANPTGQQVYGGTTDIVEDFDGACLLVTLPDLSPRGEKMVQFQFLKRRGPNADEAYAYAPDPELSYAERLASVRAIDAKDLDKYAEVDARLADDKLITVTAECIQAGFIQKMQLVREVAKRTGVSRRSAMQVLERYTGSDPDKHRWDYSVRDRGAKVFWLLDRPSDA